MSKTKQLEISLTRLTIYSKSGTKIDLVKHDQTMRNDYLKKINIKFSFGLS